VQARAAGIHRKSQPASPGRPGSWTRSRSRSCLTGSRRIAPLRPRQIGSYSARLVRKIVLADRLPRLVLSVAEHFLEKAEGFRSVLPHGAVRRLDREAAPVFNFIDNTEEMAILGIFVRALGPDAPSRVGEVQVHDLGRRCP